MERTAPRTRLIAAALAGVVTLAGLGVFASGSGPGATAQTVDTTATAVSSPASSATTVITSPTATPVTTARPEPRTGIRHAPGAFTRTVTQPGKTLPPGHGISFTDVATGVTETFALTGSDQGNYVTYQASDDNRWVIAPNGYLLDRETGNSYSWNAGMPGFIAAWGDRVLFFVLPGTYLLLNEQMETVAEIAAAPGQGYTNIPPIMSPDGTTLAFLLGETLSFVDLTAPRPAFSAAPPAGMPADVTWLSLQTTNAGNELALLLRRQPDGNGLSPVTVRRFDWQGTLLSEVTLEASDVRLSPDGKLMAWESTVRNDGYIEPFGQTRDWQAVVIGTAAGEPLFRVRGAALCMPDEPPMAWTVAPGARWLADGSALVLNTREGPALLDVRSRTLRDLNFEGAVQPAPGRTDLFSAGRLRAVTADGTILPGPDTTSFVALPELAPWGASADELRFSRSPIDELPSLCEVGAGGSPDVEAYPFTSRVARLQVAADGDCLNLRSLPGPSATVIDCIPDTTTVVVTPTTFSPYAEDVIAIATPGGGLFKCGAGIDPTIVVTVTAYHGWVHVTTPQGAKGWISSFYVDWLD